MVKDTLHAKAGGLVVGIKCRWVLCPAPWLVLPSSGEQWFDHFVAEHEERGHGSETMGDGFISLCLGYSTDDLFTSEFLQIIGGAPSAILGFTLPAQRSHLMGQLGGGEASDRRGERQDCFGTQRMRGLLKSMPPTLVLPTREGAGSCSRVPSAMKH